MVDNRANRPLLAERFYDAFMRWYNNLGKKQAEVAPLLGMTQGAFSRFINKKIDITLATMETFASSIDVDLLSFIAAGEAPPPPPTIDPERELELLRRIEAITIKWENLSDELLVKDGRIKEKDKVIAEKNQLISQLSEANGKLIDILKEAGEDDRIPPDLILAAVMSQAETERTDR